MARYKEYSYSQGKFIPIHFTKQILSGTFEYTLNYLIDNELDLSVFDSRYRNDSVGAPAFDPAILLKIVLLPIQEALFQAGRSLIKKVHLGEELRHGDKKQKMIYLNSYNKCTASTWWFEREYARSR